MKIEKDNTLFEKYYPMWSDKRKALLGKRSLDDIKEIVIHHTDGSGNWNGLKKWMSYQREDRNEAYGSGTGLFQFCVEKYEKIVNCWPLEIPVFHSCSYLHDLETLGIELIHKTGEFPKQQYKLLNFLIKDLMKRCKNLERISTHDYVYYKYKKKTKGCPGKWFRWEEVEKGLKKRKVKFVSNGKNLIELDKNYKLTELDKKVKNDSEFINVSKKQIEGVESIWEMLLKKLLNLIG